MAAKSEQESEGGYDGVDVQKTRQHFWRHQRQGYYNVELVSKVPPVVEASPPIILSKLRSAIEIRDDFKKKKAKGHFLT